MGLLFDRLNRRNFRFGRMLQPFSFFRRPNQK